jgi:type VI secretion system secreted protein Hcp
MRRVRGKEKKRRELIAVALSAVALAAASPSVAVAATDIFLKLSDIKGESIDDKHKDEIEVLSWSWGVVGANRNSPKPQQPVGPGQPACASDISIMKTVDKASPALFQRAATGTSIPTATFSVRKAGSEQQDFLVITLSDVKVTSVQQGGSGGEDRPTESISLNFSGATVTYTQQNVAGAVATPVTATIPASCQ